MFSFNQFLIELRKNPELLAQRVARRYGKQEIFGNFWNRVELGGHIPLNKYNEKISDEVEERQGKVYKKIGGKDLYGSDKEKANIAKKKYKDKVVDTTHSIKDLHPTQPYVRTDNETRLKQKIAETNPTNIYTVTHKKKTYILDGHHAVMAAKLRGETHVKAKHINLDDY